MDELSLSDAIPFLSTFALTLEELTIGLNDFPSPYSSLVLLLLPRLRDFTTFFSSLPAAAAWFRLAEAPIKCLTVWWTLFEDDWDLLRELCEGWKALEKLVVYGPSERRKCEDIYHSSALEEVKLRFREKGVKVEFCWVANGEDSEEEDSEDPEEEDSEEEEE